jgi:CheY-specific phosphatase CheX
MKKKAVEKREESVVSSVVKTFADMAFIDVVETNEPEEDFHFSQIIHISIFEPGQGDIALYLPSECKKMIVENIYGSDWDSLHATEIDDCLLEILNVLAGNFLKNYCGKGIKHNISLPELLFDETEMSRKNGFTDLFFDAEGNVFKISIRF